LARIADIWYLAGPKSVPQIRSIAGFLERSVNLDPSAGNAETRRKLCSSYLASGDLRKLLQQARELALIKGEELQARLFTAVACFLLNLKAEGQAELQYLLQRLDELTDQQLFSLLELLIGYGALDDAQAVLDGSPSQGKRTHWLNELQAQVYQERADHMSALSILTKEYLASFSEPAKLRKLHSLRAKCLDATGEYAAAHASFEAMNRAARQEYSAAGRKDAAQRYIELGPRQLPQFEFIESAPYVHAFMIGFPRSGTTLLETILGTQPDVRTLSEADAITAVRRKMIGMGKAYPDDLTRLTAKEVTRLRSAYFDHNRNYIESGEQFSVLIDKLPLNIIHVPLIKILFPEARFILSLRHPADVCLSCFQQDFILNDDMAHFTDLEGCFMRYRDVMGLFETVRAGLELAVWTVRYEDLVADLSGTVEDLCVFLGIEPDQRYRDFHAINKDRLVATPSRSQVARPIYKSAQNRWINYRAVISPFLGIVQECLDRYRYSGS
ncbi:MAG: sulfotransferase, partial [Gammaproteobacteria bacterium]|nr:sulfotransferase [Gammaproteobacteria bacterium]